MAASVLSNKSRVIRPVGLPDIGYQPPELEELKASGEVTPFRLPKKSSSPVDDVADTGPNSTVKLFSSCDQEDLSQANVLIGPTRLRLPRPPNTAPEQSNRTYNYKVPNLPRFKTKEEKNKYVINMCKFDDDELYDKSAHKRKNNKFSLPYMDPLPTPVRTPATPARSTSPTKSIHWTLGASRHKNFDRQGKIRSQGPCSRSFPVTCSAPNNWLRMKLGRCKTMVHTVH